MGEHGTGGDMLRKLARRGNKRAIAAMKAAKVKPPEELAHTLVWYSEMRRGNPRGFQYEPISHQEILAYRDLHGLEMTSFDLSLIYMLDGVWMKAQPKSDDKPPPGGPSRRGPEQSTFPATRRGM